jgi:hypothetical protein
LINWWDIWRKCSVWVKRVEQRAEKEESSFDEKWWAVGLNERE